MAIYFLRHGESEANVKLVFAGQLDDSPLTELGILQARAAADDLQQVRIDRIISSPLVRSRQTAIEVAKKIGFDSAKIEIDPRISEYDMGVLTGTPNQTITSKELISVEGAEDVQAFRDRVADFLREHASDTQNILMVSHAGVGRIIESIRQHKSPEIFYDLPPYPNAKIVPIDLTQMTL